MKKRIVITGLGVVSSIGIGWDEFWNNLIRGKSGISPVKSFDTSNHPTHVGGEVQNFEPRKFINSKKVKLLGKASIFGIAATQLALKDACLDKEDLANKVVGVCMGTTMGEIQQLEHMDKIWVNETENRLGKIDKNNVFQFITNLIPSNIAIEFGFTGPNRLFGTACAAGNYAVIHAYDLLQSGEADVMIAGGTDAFSWISFTGFNQFQAVAPEKCQPFDKFRKGMIPGEGSGILVLEPLESAQKRNAEIYAEVLGYGLSCDAFHMTQPLVDGIADCMANALKASDLKSNDIDYISAHGTGTPHNDRSEATAINRIFPGKKTPVSSIKSMLGHCMGAASALEAVTCSLSVKHDLIAPTINYETFDPECDIDCVPNKAREQRVNIALNNAFAFGGNNSSLVLKKYSN